MRRRVALYAHACVCFRRRPSTDRPEQILSELHFRRHEYGTLSFGRNRVRGVRVAVLRFAETRRPH